MSRVLIPVLLLLTGTMPSTYFYPVFALVLGYLTYQRCRCIPISTLMPLASLIFIVLANMAFIETRDSLRDLWYFSKIIIIAMTGLLLGVSYGIDPKWFRKLTIVILILTILNLASAISSLAIEESRHLSFAAAFMGPFILSYQSKRNNSAQVIRISIILIIIGMVALSGSRAGLLTLIVAYLASRGIFQRAHSVLFAAVTIVASVLIIWPYLPQYDIGNITFLGKLQNSINEIAFNTGEDRIEMYSNWRGFEAYRAYQTWLNASFIEKVFGLGFGAAIDLGKLVAYGNTEVTKLAFVHNAYFTLLVKVGIFGILAMVYTLLLPFRIQRDRHDPNTIILNQISCGTAIVLLLTMALNAGPLNKESMDGLLLIWAWSSGAMIRIRRQAKFLQDKGYLNNEIDPRSTTSSLAIQEVD